MSTESIHIAHNAVTAKLMGASRDLALQVQAMLSYVVEGAEHHEAFKAGHWDGRSTFFTLADYTFPAGFVRLIQFKLEKLGHRVGIVKKPLPAPLGAEKPLIDEFGYTDDRYDYQPDTVHRLVKYGQMIAQVATGGGKSRIANLTVARIKRKNLFLTTRGVLMHQMHKSFRKALRYRAANGEPELKQSFVGVLGDGTWHPSDYINVGMVQTFAAKLKDPDPRWAPAKKQAHLRERQEVIALLASFELVILEEAHEARGDSYYEILRHCRNAHYRLSLTATPFMSEDAEANMRLMACSGPVAIKITEKMLIDRGILARPFFKTLVTKYVADKAAIEAWGDREDKRVSTILGRGSSWQRAYRLGVVFNRWRNERIVDECARSARLSLPAMVLVQHKDHGELLCKMLRERGLSAQFIFGEHEQSERESALNALGKGSLQVLIGSTILDVGVDVPAVGLVALAGGGKAEISLRQRIGRGLRSKKSGPNVALILDFFDDFNFHLKSHSIQRRQIIEGTPGFVEGLLPINQDFNLPALGLAA